VPSSKKYNPDVKNLFLGFLILFLIILGLVSWYWWELQPVSSSTNQISFVVSKSEPGDSIINRLHVAKLVRSVIASKIYLRLQKLSHRLKPGDYLLASNATTPQIFTVLVSGPKDIRVTIPEGWRREQIAVRLKNSLTHFNSDEFIQISATREGQLFPDTYLLPPQATPSDVLNIFLKNFAKKTNLDVSQFEDQSALILASLIEREAKTDSDRGLIAGILKKRLDSGWPLQVDASVQYAVNKADNWWQPIFDTKYPSLYNTYLYPGLPPGPICNPGLASIQAAKNPQSSSYWYYLTGSDGITRYADNLTQHHLNIDKYVKP
jgi:UPF0755 protein